MLYSLFRLVPASVAIARPLFFRAVIKEVPIAVVALGRGRSLVQLFGGTVSLRRTLVVIVGEITSIILPAHRRVPIMSCRRN